MEPTNTQVSNQPVMPDQNQGVTPEVSNTNQTLPSQPAQPSVVIGSSATNIFLKLKDNKVGKVVLILGGIILVLTVIAIIANMVRKMSSNRPSATPTPVAIFVPTPSPVSSIPSRYASDSAVLKIEEDVNSLDKDMSSSNFRDSNLKEPQVRFDQNFQKN